MTLRPLLAVLAVATLALAGCAPAADGVPMTSDIDPEASQPQITGDQITGNQITGNQITGNQITGDQGTVASIPQPLIERPLGQSDGVTLYESTCTVDLTEGGGPSPMMVQTYGACEEAARARCGDNGYVILSSDQTAVRGNANALTTLTYRCQS